MKLRRIFLVLFLFVCSLLSYANEPVLFTKKNTGEYIGKNISIFKDPTRKLSFEEVYKKKNFFTKFNQEVPNLGVHATNNWLHFSVINNSDLENLVINVSHTNIDEIVLYWIRDGVVDSLNGKAKKRGNTGEFYHQYYLFDVNAKQGEQIDYYLKVFSNTQLSAPISIHTPSDLMNKLRNTDIFSAIYIGLMLSMLLYNMFLYISTREPHYFSYVNYIFWVVVAQLAILGLLEPLLSLNNNWITSRLLTLTGALSGLAAIFFVKSFLQTAKESPKFNILLNIFIAGYLFSIGLLLVGNIIPAYNMVNIIAGGGSTIVLILAFQLSREKYRQTKYFLFAWCIFLISVLVYVLKDHNVLPHNFFTLRAIQIGSVIEAILLSFALGDKINIYRKEKEESQSKAMEMLLENERLIRVQNIELEKKVEERTRDLTTANMSLTATLKNLKETQSQLVEAEKMASLGQLTAGVAHEINNPINFVISNVAPLKRDIEMVWDSLSEFEQLALREDITKDEKIEWISKYKEEADIDYLKTEVEFLLKGMHEGATRTAEIVKSLRVFSRVDEDTLKNADVNEGLESTMVILNSLLKDKIKVNKKYGEIPFIECYAGKLNQVFLNILTNAIYAIDKKFKQEVGGLLEIETGVKTDKDNIFVRITDNGIGIPDEIIGKVFEPFFTTKDVGEGTGLGMSIAYKTIEKHKGNIKVSSKLGEGTSFEIAIPIRQTV